MSDRDSTFHTRPSLLLRVRNAQDAEAWQLFIEVYGPLIYRYCKSRDLQDADAADVAQEVLAQVAHSMRTFTYQPERGRFRDWLGTVTRRKIGRFLRGRSQDPGQPVAADLDNFPTAEADAEWTDAFNAHLLGIGLQRVRACLEPGTWKAFERVWLDDRPAPEVSAELKIPIASVYLAKSRVLKRLRQVILDLAEDWPAVVPLS
jgi:RNA polymerase sigma-70 factor (ECF subfamily)